LFFLLDLLNEKRVRRIFHDKGSGRVEERQRDGPVMGAKEPVNANPLGDADVRQRLVRLAYRFLWNRDDAEDVAQETLAAAFVKAPKLREPEKWWSWLCRIAIRQCHLQGRRKQRRGRYEKDVASNRSETCEDSPPAEGAEALESIRQWLGELPRRQREVLVLRHFEDRSFDEIAELLGIRPTTARVHAQQGRERLMEHWVRRFPKEGSHGAVGKDRSP
jgi:RNA polymerase sigma-70 factor (ECF subfamily)